MTHMHADCPNTVWSWKETKWTKTSDIKWKANKLWNTHTDKNHSAIKYHDFKE